MRSLNKTILLLFVVLLLAPLSAYGEMTSSIYAIYADSIEVNGGQYSSSTTYTLTDTNGESGSGDVASSTYTISGGFQAMNQDEIMTLNLSTSTVDLGSLNAQNVNAASVDIGVQSNAITGYTVSLSDVSGTMPPAVTDGSVTANVDEYGLGVTGPNAGFGDDEAVANGLIIASSTHEVALTTTTLTFKASYAATAAGNYSQSMTLTAAANF